jgi:hypothetical protein
VDFCQHLDCRSSTVASYERIPLTQVYPPDRHVYTSTNGRKPQESDVSSLQPTNFPKQHKLQNPYRYYYRYRQVTERQRMDELVGRVSAKILMTARRVLESPTTARRRKLCTELHSLALRDEFLGACRRRGARGPNGFCLGLQGTGCVAACRQHQRMANTTWKASMLI